MKQLNLLKNRGKKISVPLKSVLRLFVVALMLLTTLQMSAQEKEKLMYVAITDSVAVAYFDNLYDDVREEKGT